MYIYRVLLGWYHRPISNCITIKLEIQCLRIPRTLSWLLERCLSRHLDILSTSHTMTSSPTPDRNVRRLPAIPTQEVRGSRIKGRILLCLTSSKMCNLPKSCDSTGRKYVSRTRFPTLTPCDIHFDPGSSFEVGRLTPSIFTSRVLVILPAWPKLALSFIPHLHIS